MQGLSARTLGETENTIPSKKLTNETVNPKTLVGLSKFEVPLLGSHIKDYSLLVVYTLRIGE